MHALHASAGQQRTIRSMGCKEDFAPAVPETETVVFERRGRNLDSRADLTDGKKRVET